MADDKKKLKPPTNKDRLKGLPKSKAEAIKRGLTRYLRDGEEWVIRNYGSKTAPQGRDTLAWKRKASRGAGTKGSRKEYEWLSTPPKARQGDERKAFNKLMVTARGKNLVGDHKYSVARTGNALKLMSPERQALYHQRFKDAGIDIGNQVGNIDEVTEAVNQAKVGEEKRLDKHLKELSQKEKVQARFIAKEREKYSDYPEWKKGEVVIGGNGVNGGNGPAKGNLLSKLKSTKAKVGGALLGMGSLMPTVKASERIQQQISEGDKLGAAKTYGKDLLVGQAASRSFAGIMKGAQSQLAKTIGPKLARQALKIAGRKLFKKGAALATGPVAPAVLTSLLIKDAYDVANVISGGKLKIRENKDMSSDERKRAVERLKFIK
tara:strand:+ start:40 stop:1173 length:1134 start_codon:yes stop_codon:yes gene_type:complete